MKDANRSILGRRGIPVRLASALTVAIALAAGSPAGAQDLHETVRTRLDAEYASLETIYRDLHANPELSFMEVRTAGIVARELRALGIEVTEKVGNTGVVGVLRNGAGPTVLLRADMDALPIQETSGVPYASKAVVKDLSGREYPAMHACGHDAHVTGLIGTARLLVALKDRWSGTVVFVGQPAEEILAGARAMLSDGLYTRFPRPDFALAIHASAYDPAGMLGYRSGPLMAGVSSVDIVVRGVSGHGSAPHTAKDPVLLASQIVVALQAIVSREIKPGVTALVTVGTIHGGTRRNIIPDEVRLELTVRAHDDAVLRQLVAAIRRISEGTARAAGLPDELLPVVSVTDEAIEPVVNDVALTERLFPVFRAWLGPERVRELLPLPGGEDFTLYGRTRERVPIMMWRVGATAPEKFEESRRTGVPVPSTHSSGFVPVPEPTLKAAVTSMTAAVLELLGKP